MPAQDSNLSRKAFGDLADRRLVVACKSQQDALRFLSTSMGQASGVAVLRGPQGSGKSILVREQLAWAKEGAAAALLNGENLTPRRLVKDMLAQFGVASPTQADDQMLLQQLSDFVGKQTRDGKTPVLIVDDAEKATSSALRLLNWLAALEWRHSFALRIVLAGQDRLIEVIHDDGMRNFMRRRPATYSLNPLTSRETIIYVRTRWIAAGGEHAERVFPIDICSRLHEFTAGWPGGLNKRAIEVLNRMAELDSAKKIPRLLVTRDRELLADYALTKREYVIGRSDLADIVIEDTYISKIHAMIKVYSNAVVLVDLNSTNGTTVNSRIVQKTVLRSNDIITLGHYRLKLENAPALSAEIEEKVKASDTMRLRNLDDYRRARARRTIKVLKHK